MAEWFHGCSATTSTSRSRTTACEIQKLCAEGAIDIANKLGLPLVATSDAHYLAQADSVAHDVLLCINTGRLRSTTRTACVTSSDQFHVRGPEEMYRLFPGQDDAVQRSQEIADGVDIELDFKKRHFPVFTPPAGKTPEQLPARAVRGRAAASATATTRRRRRATGWSTSWASSAAWASPATS